MPRWGEGGYLKATGVDQSTFMGPPEQTIKGEKQTNKTKQEGSVPHTPEAAPTPPIPTGGGIASAPVPE